MQPHELITIFGAVAMIVAAIWFARSQNLESWFYSASLISLPIFYMFFGLLSGEMKYVGLEFVYGIPYFIAGGVMMLWRFRLSCYLLAAFWIAHAGYDFYHDSFFVNPGVWSWYPLFCAVIDFVLGAYLIYLATQLPRGTCENTLR